VTAAVFRSVESFARPGQARPARSARGSGATVSAADGRHAAAVADLRGAPRRNGLFWLVAIETWSGAPAGPGPGPGPGGLGACVRRREGGRGGHRGGRWRGAGGAHDAQATQEPPHPLFFLSLRVRRLGSTRILEKYVALFKLSVGIIYIGGEKYRCL